MYTSHGCKHECRKVKASYHELKLRYDRREKVSRALGVMEMKQAVAVRSRPQLACL